MYKTILILLAVFPAVLFGQETKKVKVKHDNSYYKEIYYVLKSNRSVRHGSYQKIGYKDAVILHGFYKNGVKDSIWTEFYRGGNIKFSIGTYFDDKQVGVWTFYDGKGDREQIYDYTKKELVYFKFSAEELDKEFRIIKKMDTIKMKLDRPPLYIGGFSTVFQFISKNMKYPKDAIRNGVSGEVIISFIIDSNGKTSNHIVTTGIGYGCDEEALRVIKKIPDNWFPGLIKEQAVDVEYVFPIRYTLR